MKNIFKIKNSILIVGYALFCSINVHSQNSFPATGNVSIGSELGVIGTTRMGTATVANTLTVTGTAKLNGTADVLSNFSVGGASFVNGDALFKSKIEVLGDSFLKRNAFITGNVSIGTLSSDAALQFSNDISKRKIVLYNTGTNPNQYYGFTVDPYILRYQVDGTGSSHVFYSGNNASSSKELMRIKGNGLVGIGTNIPSATLEINGDTRMTSQLRFKNSSNSLPNAKGIVWGDNTYNGNFSRIDDDGDLKILTDDNMYLGKLNGDGTPGSCAIYANVNTGNVGIGGVTNPTQKLEVNGNALIGNAVIYYSPNGGFGLIHKNLIDSASAQNYTLFGSSDGSYTYINKKDTGTGYIGFKVGNVDKAVILNNGNMGIGTITPSSKLAVNGTVTALNYAVTAAMAADYVFESDYKLKTLSETDAYIKANKHLPAFKSAKHYEANGYTMVEMNIALEQTVEELTLHAIAQEKEISSMKTELAEIKALLLAKK